MNTNILPTCVKRLVQEIWHRCSKLLHLDRCHYSLFLKLGNSILPYYNKMTSKEVTNLCEKIHSRALHRDKNTVIDQVNNFRISLYKEQNLLVIMKIERN